MGKLNVIIVDATGNKEQKVGLPDDIKVGIIMVKLVEKIKLPSTGPDGNPISYKFIHKVSGRQLLETQTLADANIKDGDVLRLQPEITAGAVCPKCGKVLNDGVAFCDGCGQSLYSAPAQNTYAQTPNNAYGAYNPQPKSKADIIFCRQSRLTDNCRYSYRVWQNIFAKSIQRIYKLSFCAYTRCLLPVLRHYKSDVLPPLRKYPYSFYI